MGHANIINFQVQSQFQIFLNKLCVCFLTQMKDIRQGFHSVTWGFGVGGGGQKLNFLNMVMWHIKLKGMISRPGYTEKFYPKVKLVTLGLDEKVKYH